MQKLNQNLKKFQKHMESFQIAIKDSNMICLEVLEGQADLEVFEVDDFKQKIYQIYFLHFLAEVFLAKTRGKLVVNNVEKISNMICI